MKNEKQTMIIGTIEFIDGYTALVHKIESVYTGSLQAIFDVVDEIEAEVDTHMQDYIILPQFGGKVSYK